MYGSTGLVSEKAEALFAEPNERVEAATSSYTATGKFLRYIYSVSVAQNHQEVKFMNFSFTDIFFNFVLYDCGFLLLS